MNIRIRRVYEAPSPDDGRRILIDGLWPRGLSKQKAKVDVWMKDIAPSRELRRWYAHDSEKWAEFRKRYHAELDANSSSVDELLSHMAKDRSTLLFGSREERLNNAYALKEYLESKAGHT